MFFNINVGLIFLDIPWSKLLELKEISYIPIKKIIHLLDIKKSNLIKNVR